MANGDKEYRIHLKTTGDPSGAKEVEKAIDDAADSAAALEAVTETTGSLNTGDTISITKDLRAAEEAAEDLKEAIDDTKKSVKDFSDAPPLPFKPAEVQPSIKSIDQLTKELQRLQAELNQVPVGGKRFQELAGQIGRTQQEIRLAHQEVRKLGGDMGRGGNAGMAVLEFSRAFEDAQYGMRGVLNNIPTLLALLGLGPGLAGVVSVAAVAATQLWEAFSDTDSAEEGIDRIAEAAEKFTERMKKLRDRQKEVAALPTTDLDASLTEETTALKLQTAAFQANVQAIRDRIAAAEALEAIRTQGALANIDRREQGGAITAEEADRQRAAIEKTAKERQLARANELSKLDEEVAVEAREAARRELEAAKARKDAADLSLREKENELEQLKREMARRGQINAALAQIEDAERTLDERNVPEEFRSAAGAQQVRAQAAANFGKIADSLTRSAEAIEALVSAREALGLAEGVGAPPRARPPIAKETEEATEAIAKYKDAVVDAAEKVTAANAALKLAEQSAEAAQARQEAQRGALGDQAAAGRLNDLEAQLQQAGENSAARIGKTLENILTVLGDAAQRPEVQAQATKVQALLKDGLQASEEGQVLTLLNQLISAIRTSDTRRAGLLQQVISAVSDGANADLRLQAEIRDLRNTVNSLKASQGNPNP